MSNLTDSTYLRNIQYRDSSNLSARACLHERFSINKIGWHTWVFQQLELPHRSKILEVGCGPAYLWQKNLPTLSDGWRVFLSDLSQGMLEEARDSLREISHFSYTSLDGSNLPFPEGFFDAVIANHVLYHLPALPLALSEIRRVLKPGCCLYAATNGEKHLHEIRQWKERFCPENDQAKRYTPTTRFSLENGASQLQNFFHSVQLRCYPDQLEINEVEPILRYIESYLDYQELQQPLERLRLFLDKTLEKDGFLKVTKETGIFQAVKR